MKQYLYSKNDKIMELEVDNGAFVKINDIYMPEKLPIFLQYDLSIDKFNSWLKKRGIPESRENLRDVRLEFGTKWEKSKHYACLSDQFWIRTGTETWDKINFFTNKYSPEVGDLFFKPWQINKKKKINNFSPDVMTNGLLRKRWIQADDKTSSLVKAGSITMHQEPLSEVLASVTMERLEIIPFVPYDLHVEGVTMCSICKNFIDENHEFIPAYHFYMSEPRNPEDSVYTHLIKMCDKYELEGAKEFIDNMIFIDRITGNEDRTLSNFGWKKDVRTNEIIGPAPLFDSGEAYWSTKAVKTATKSKLFNDVEESIYENAKKKYNMEVLLGDYGFKDMIQNYPNISQTKKENMIDAIKKKGRELNKTSVKILVQNDFSR